MNKGLPTFVRQDIYTGPYSLARRNKEPFFYKLFPKRLQKAGALSRTFLPEYLPERLLMAVGSREHYYHFLVGYLLPLVHSQSEHRFKKFLALDCGPLMTPILHESLSRLGYDFRLVGINEIENPVYVKKWDSQWNRRKENDAVKIAIELIRQAWKDHSCPGNLCSRSENLLIRRSSPHQFYLDGSSELAGYGTSRRGISNLEEISEFLSQNGVPNSIFEPGAHNLGCQIQAYTAAKKILGFRGADWANLLWSNKEVHVRMLDDSPPARIIGNFMTRLQIKHEFAIVDSCHSPENPQEALRFFREK